VVAKLGTMTRIVPSALMTLCLLLCASASPAVAARSADATSAARAPSCPYGKVCLWSAANFKGSKLIRTPVPSGRCVKIADTGSGWSSVYNNTFKYARLWQYTYTENGGTKCGGRPELIRPRAARATLSIRVAMGLGGY
jgi:Peptidase inhibitor family I36